MFALKYTALMEEFITKSLLYVNVLLTNGIAEFHAIIFLHALLTKFIVL